MQISRPVAFASGAVMALVLGSGTAYAATGGKFILGKSNSATTVTTLTNARSTALALNSKAGTAPLRVNSSTKVGNLNSDKLDNYDSSAFALASGQTNTVDGFSDWTDVDGDGSGDVMVGVATCPAGTKLTGGGGDDVSADGTLFLNSPIDKQSWAVASTTQDPNPGNVRAYALCYNPRGGVSGGAFRVAPQQPTTQAMAELKERLAAKVG